MSIKVLEEKSIFVEADFLKSLKLFWKFCFFVNFVVFYSCEHSCDNSCELYNLYKFKLYDGRSLLILNCIKRFMRKILEQNHKLKNNRIKFSYIYKNKIYPN